MRSLPRLSAAPPIAVLAILAALVIPATAGSAPQQGSGLQSELNKIVRMEQGPPGISVLIHRPGHTRYLSAGVGNVERGRAPTPILRMRIASMAKAFNGAVALALVSKGKLHLGDTIDDLLPGVWPQAGHVTLRQLLRHTSGLPDYIKDPVFSAWLDAHPTQYLTPREILDYVDGQATDFDPGSEYAYSDTDNIVVGLMAEAATGRSYDWLLKHYVYKPAGLNHTTLPKTVKMPRPYLRGYDVPASGPPEDASEVINPALAWASGGIVSTAWDLGRFFRAYVGNKLFDAKAGRAQRKFVSGSSSPPGPGENGAGLGLFRYETQCGKVFGHTGSFPGYRQFAASTHNGKRSVIFTVNSQIIPGSGSKPVSDAIRGAQETAVCKIRR